MLFPEWFTTFYSGELVLQVLNYMNVTPDDDKFLRIGQVNLTLRNDGIDPVLFGFFYFEDRLDNEIESENIKENSMSESYFESDFLNDVFMDEKNYLTLVSLLESKKNVIIQGPPGVGKTFIAERLAWSMMGKKPETASQKSNSIRTTHTRTSSWDTAPRRRDSY